MEKHERSRTLRRDLRAIWVDGLAWSVMVGMGEQSIQMFAAALGLASSWTGLVATVPMIAGALVQLVSPWLVRRLGSHRRWVAICAGVQAASFAPLVWSALTGGMSGWLLFTVAGLYWAAGLATAPAWNTWVETLVPARARIRYFARRNRWLYVFQVLGLVAAGVILQGGRSFDDPLRAFAIVFLFALVARSLSTALISLQSEPAPIPRGMSDVGPVEFVRRLRHESGGRLLAYMLAAQFAAYTAAPFLVPYYLRGLGFTYAETMTLLALAVVGRFASLPLLGRFAERHGLHALLWLGGIAIVPSAGLMLLGTSFGYLVCAQLFSGLAWGAWDLATFLSFFDSIKKTERTSMLTSHQLLNALAIGAGSILGGVLLARLGGGPTAFLTLFALSAGLRLGTIFLLRRVGPVPRGLSIKSPLASGR